MEQIKPLFAAAAIASVLVGSLVTGAALNWQPSRPNDAVRAEERTGSAELEPGARVGDQKAEPAPERNAVPEGYVAPEDIGAGSTWNTPEERAASYADMVDQVKRELAVTPDAFDGGPLAGGSDANADTGDFGFGSGYYLGGDFGGESREDGEREGRQWFREGRKGGEREEREDDEREGRKGGKLEKREEREDDEREVRQWFREGREGFGAGDGFQGFRGGDDDD